MTSSESDSSALSAANGPRLMVVPYAAAAVVVLAMVWPMTRPVTEDGYPISHFPMFALGRTTPVLSLSFVRGVQGDGTRRPISPKLTANGTVMQVAGSTARAIAQGDAELFCESVAARVANSSERSIAEIEIVTGSFHIIEYFSRAPKALAEQIHARCRVSRAPRAALH